MPIKTAEPIVDLSRKTLLIFGSPKVGKSTFAASFPGATFLATEAGLNDLTCNRYEYPDGRYVISSWDELLAATAELVTAGVKMIVLDTCDNAYAMCEQHVCAKFGVEYKTDDKLSFGKGSSIINGEFKRYLTKLSSLGLGLILTSHATQEQRDTRMGKVAVSVPTIPDKIRPTITGMVDMILYCDARMAADGVTVERVIHSKPNPFFEAGDRTGRLPEVLPLNYQAFAAAYNLYKPTTENATNKKETK